MLMLMLMLMLDYCSISTATNMACKNSEPQLQDMQSYIYISLSITKYYYTFSKKKKNNVILQNYLISILNKYWYYLLNYK